VSGVLDTARATAGAAGRVALSRFVRRPRLDLDGRTVLVTGAGRGLGEAIAREAHARGANVALMARSVAPLDQLATELGDRALAAPADITDLAAVTGAAADVAERFGGIDVRVAPPSDSILSIDPDAFERTIEVDLLGQWRSLRATLPHLVERQGHVLAVSSIYAFFNGVLNASYAMSKAGVEQLTRAARVELAAYGATAGVAYLGFIDTELIADAFADSDVAAARATIPRFITKPMSAEHAARAVVDGIESRSPTVTAPAWVAPTLALRSAVTTVMDEVLLDHGPFQRAVHASDERAR
jgi:NAD(P)-dependent dehydrogenase (short-subunit alcohol dehydrogenase family)